MNGPLAGGVLDSAIGNDEYAQLRELVDDVGRRARDARAGQRHRRQALDDTLWRTLEDTGLTRLTSTPDGGAGPIELAIVLHGLARYAAAVPIAETDLLAGWL